MKLVIKQLVSASHIGHAFAFQIEQDGEVHSIELTGEAQSQVALGLLVSEPVADGAKPRLILQPTGVRTQKTSGGKIGLALQLGPNAAIHFLLTPQESAAVREQLSVAERMNVRPH